MRCTDTRPFGYSLFLFAYSSSGSHLHHNTYITGVLVIRSLYPHLQGRVYIFVKLTSGPANRTLSLSRARRLNRISLGYRVVP